MLRSPDLDFQVLEVIDERGWEINVPAPEPAHQPHETLCWFCGLHDDQTQLYRKYLGSRCWSLNVRDLVDLAIKQRLYDLRGVGYRWIEYTHERYTASGRKVPCVRSARIAIYCVDRQKLAQAYLRFVSARELDPYFAKMIREVKIRRLPGETHK